ncbi:KH domain-containing protein [Desulfocurvibacter africanus]|uniref:KH domain-containing protein n=1 Tax=Desulfocurvibacter africanus TaxID=873 RepID=UPI00042024B6|nr:KH domain-containing protein [Desulfocurvibacter africanus]
MPKELITYLVKALVDYPEMVQVTEVVGENVIILEVKVAKEDVGKVIGKSGRTVLALRDILAAVAGKGKQRVVLDILE